LLFTISSGFLADVRTLYCFSCIMYDNTQLLY
jgi:hypothetical protein